MDQAISPEVAATASSWAITVAGLTGSILYMRNRRKVVSNDDDRKPAIVEVDDKYSRKLNKLERRFQPIVAVTWFEGGDKAMDEAASILKKRIESIVAANPWLAGNLEKKGSDIFLEYPRKVNAAIAVREIFSKRGDSKIHHEMVMTDLVGIARENQYCLLPHKDYEQSLWKIVMVPSITDPSKFAIFTSMAHYVGDGHTYYSLYNMLIAGAKVESLNEIRVPDAEEKLASALGKIEFRMLNTVGLIWAAIKGAVLTQVMGPLLKVDKYKKYAKYMLIESEKIEKMKKMEMERLNEEPHDKTHPKFVSTNDILTSWFLGNCGHRHGIMAINLRGRIPDFQYNLAGNYANAIYMRAPEDVSSPILIRQAVSRLKRVVTAHQDPTEFEMSTGGICAVTSWASFTSKVVDLGVNCRQIVHMPCLDLTIRGGTALAICIIFRATPTHLGMLVAGTGEVQERLRDAPFESKLPFPLLSSELFEGETQSSSFLIRKAYLELANSWSMNSKK